MAARSTAPQGAEPGAWQDTLETIILNIDSLDGILHLATIASKPEDTARPDAAPRLQKISTGLHKINQLLSDLSHGFDTREKTLQQQESKSESFRDYLVAIIAGLRENLEWIEDPQDSSTCLENIYNAEEVGKLVARRFNEMQDSVNHHAGLNSRLQQDLKKMSREAASTTEQLHTQTKLAKTAQNENAELSMEVSKAQKELQQAQTRLKVTQEQLARDKVVGTQRQAERNTLTETVKKLEAELNTTKVRLKQQTKSAVDAGAKGSTCERQIHTLLAQVASLRTDSQFNIKRAEEANAKTDKIVVELRAVIEVLKNDLRVETEKSCDMQKTTSEEVARLNATLHLARTEAAQEKLLRYKTTADLADITERLKRESAANEATMAVLKTTQSQNEDLVNTNKDLNTEIVALQADLEGEKLSRERITSEYKGLLEKQRVETEEMVGRFKRELSEQCIDMEIKIKSCEALLRSHTAASVSQVDSAREEAVIARKEASQLQNETKHLQERSAAQDNVVRSLCRKLYGTTVERDKLRAWFDQSSAERQRLSRDLETIRGGLRFEEQGNTETHAQEGLHDKLNSESLSMSSQQQTQVDVVRESRGCHTTNSSEASLGHWHVSRKRATVELETDYIQLLLSHASKRPRLDAGTPQDAPPAEVSSPRPDPILTAPIHQQDTTPEPDMIVGGQLMNDTQIEVTNGGLGASTTQSEPLRAEPRHFPTSYHSTSTDTTPLGRECCGVSTSSRTTVEAALSHNPVDHGSDKGTKSTCTPAMSVSEISRLRDDKHTKQLERMTEKWGPCCGVPEPWREGLKLKDAIRRLQALYNKVESLGENPVQYLWKEDGILTRACTSSPNRKLNSQALLNALQELTAIYPDLPLHGSRRRSSAESTLSSADDGTTATHPVPQHIKEGGAQPALLVHSSGTSSQPRPSRTHTLQRRYQDLDRPEQAMVEVKGGAVSASKTSPRAVMGSNVVNSATLG